jgi:putative ABC transport system permease protein
MKFLGYIVRNALRNKLRTLLTIGSITICALLAMLLFAFIDLNRELGQSTRGKHRLVTWSTQGFAGEVPIGIIREIAAVDEESGNPRIVRGQNGEPAITPLSWFGGKYGDDPIPFTQFGVYPEYLFTVFDEFTIPPDQLAAFEERRDAVVVGRKLAKDKNLKIGDPLPLKGDIYPVDLNLIIAGIFDGSEKTDLRSAYFHWEYLNEKLKTVAEGRMAENAGTIWFKAKDAASLPILSKTIDDMKRNSGTPTRTQTEEAFATMFADMMGGLKEYINGVGVAVLAALVLICFVSLSMSVRERTTEIAVLRAIGFRKPHVLFMVLAESLLIAAVGGLISTIGAKLFFDRFDVSPYLAGFVPLFYIPWPVAIWGMVGALAVGLVSGVVPAILAARVPVVDGLRKVV